MCLLHIISSIIHHPYTIEKVTGDTLGSPPRCHGFKNGEFILFSSRSSEATSYIMPCKDADKALPILLADLCILTVES